MACLWLGAPPAQDSATQDKTNTPVQPAWLIMYIGQPAGHAELKGRTSVCGAQECAAGPANGLITRQGINGPLNSNPLVSLQASRQLCALAGAGLQSYAAPDRMAGRAQGACLLHSRGWVGPARSAKATGSQHQARQDLQEPFCASSARCRLCRHVATGSVQPSVRVWSQAPRSSSASPWQPGLPGLRSRQHPGEACKVPALGLATGPACTCQHRVPACTGLLLSQGGARHRPLRHCRLRLRSQHTGTRAGRACGQGRSVRMRSRPADLTLPPLAGRGSRWLRHAPLKTVLRPHSGQAACQRAPLITQKI